MEERGQRGQLTGSPSSSSSAGSPCGDRRVLRHARSGASVLRTPAHPSPAGFGSTQGWGSPPPRTLAPYLLAFGTGRAGDGLGHSGESRQVSGAAGGCSPSSQPGSTREAPGRCGGSSALTCPGAPASPRSPLGPAGPEGPGMPWHEQRSPQAQLQTPRAEPRGAPAATGWGEQQHTIFPGIPTSPSFPGTPSLPGTPGFPLSPCGW